MKLSSHPSDDFVAKASICLHLSKINFQNLLKWEEYVEKGFVKVQCGAEQ